MQNHKNYSIEVISKELTKPLPGIDYQRKMLPKSRLTELMTIPENVKKGAVLVLLYEDMQQLMTALIERTDDGGVHSKQISLPGGKYEESDNDLIETALREANEEVGVDLKNITVLGNLSTMYIPVSNYTVSPVVGYYSGNPNFKTNPTEVASLLEVPIALLLDEKNRRMEIVDVRGTQLEVPVFKVGKHQIWGATAMILSEFVQVLKNINGKFNSIK